MTNPAFSDAAEPALGLQLVQEDQELDPDDDPAGGGAVLDIDEEAPFGRFSNGKPRKSPPGSRASKPARRLPGAPRKVAPAAARQKDSGPDYIGATEEILAVGQAILASVATLTKSGPLQADMATLVVMTPKLALISADVAKTETRWASILERAATTSKWGAPLTVAVALVAQVAVNHGAIPPGLMGTKSGPELLEQADELLRARQAAAEKAAAKREQQRAA